MKTTDLDPSARGSAELWLEAAYEALLAGGVDAVRILTLAQKLGMSRASFYWSFRTRDDLLNALLEHWAGKNTFAIAERARAYADTLPEAILNVCDCWFDQKLFDARLELAIRSWALQSPDVLARVRAGDEIRLQALVAMFTRFGIAEELAEVRARTMYLVQIGYIAMQTEESMATRLKRLAPYVEALGATVPTPREMMRFYARNDLLETATASGLVTGS